MKFDKWFRGESLGFNIKSWELITIIYVPTEESLEAGPGLEVRPHLRVMASPGHLMKKYCLGRDMRLGRADTDQHRIAGREPLVNTQGCRLRFKKELMIYKLLSAKLFPDSWNVRWMNFIVFGKFMTSMFTWHKNVSFLSKLFGLSENVPANVCFIASIMEILFASSVGKTEISSSQALL